MKIEILLEEDGRFGATIKVDKENIYGVGATLDELIDDLKKWIDCAQGSDKKTKKSYTLLQGFLQARKYSHAVNS